MIVWVLSLLIHLNTYELFFPPAVCACRNRVYPIYMYMNGTEQQPVNENGCVYNGIDGSYNCTTVELPQPIEWQNNGNIFFYFANTPSFSITRIELQSSFLPSSAGRPNISFEPGFGSITGECPGESMRNVTTNITGFIMNSAGHITQLRIDISFSNFADCFKSFYLNRILFCNSGKLKEKWLHKVIAMHSTMVFDHIVITYV